MLVRPVELFIILPVLASYVAFLLTDVLPFDEDRVVPILFDSLVLVRPADERTPSYLPDVERLLLYLPEELLLREEDRVTPSYLVDELRRLLE